MGRPKISTRKLMAIVFAMALGLGFGIPAWEVYRDRRYHMHGWVKLNETVPVVVWDGESRQPF